MQLFCYNIWFKTLDSGDWNKLFTRDNSKALKTVSRSKF